MKIDDKAEYALGCSYFVIDIPYHSMSSVSDPIRLEA